MSNVTTTRTAGFVAAGIWALILLGCSGMLWQTAKDGAAKRLAFTGPWEGPSYETRTVEVDRISLAPTIDYGIHGAVIARGYVIIRDTKGQLYYEQVKDTYPGGGDQVLVKIAKSSLAKPGDRLTLTLKVNDQGERYRKVIHSEFVGAQNIQHDKE